MYNLFKYSLVFLGSGLIGIGIGIIFGKFLISKGALLWLSVIISLVLGGFIMALGLMTKKHPKEKDKDLQNSNKF